MCLRALDANFSDKQAGFFELIDYRLVSLFGVTTNTKLSQPIVEGSPFGVIPLFGFLLPDDDLPAWLLSQSSDEFIGINRSAVTELDETRFIFHSLGFLHDQTD